MTALRVVAAIVVALILQSVVARLVGNGQVPVDLVLVSVVSTALLYGRVAGLLGGSLAGLAQDALSGGVLGIGGLANSVVGFFTGMIGTQFIVTQAVPRFLLYTGATAVHAGIYIGLSVLLGLRRFDRAFVEVTIQALANGVVGVLVFEIIDALPGTRQRWRARRERRRKIRFH